MMSMRTLIALCILAAASPAVGQPTQLQLDDLRIQQQNAERRAIDQSNQLQALDARLRADQAAADLRAQRAGVLVPELRYEPPAPVPATLSAKYPSMPDAALAESNRRVQDAAKNRR
jgi:hypothetical protein